MTTINVDIKHSEQKYQTYSYNLMEWLLLFVDYLFMAQPMTMIQKRKDNIEQYQSNSNILLQLY